MKLRLALLVAALATGSLFATPPAQAACTHVDGLVPLYVCAAVNPSEPSAEVCPTASRCVNIGARER